MHAVDIERTLYGPFPTRDAAEEFGTELAGRISQSEGGSVVSWDIRVMTPPRLD